MKNFVKVASLVATLALAACQTNPSTTFAPKADPVNSRNVQNSDSQIWLSGDYGATTAQINCAGKQATTQIATNPGLRCNA